jgi:molybdenum cofactor cytidylyltransferase
VTIGILLLAAGRSRRFGSDKRFASLGDGKAVLEASVASAVASGLPVRVCIRQGDDEACRLASRLGADCLICESADRGMANTLAEAVAQLGQWDGVLVSLADMPCIAPATYRQVAGALGPERICVPTWRGRRGHPVGFGGAYFEALTALSGDEGARTLLKAHADAVVSVPVEDSGIIQDVDTLEDIEALGRR